MDRIGRAGHGVIGQGQAIQSRAGKCKGNAKDNAGHSTLQDKANGMMECETANVSHTHPI